MLRVLQLSNLALLLLFPIAWAAPLMRAGVLPLFGLSEVSILSGLSALWQDGEWALAGVVALFALLFPMAKTGILVLIHVGHSNARLQALAQIMGKLAMADVFLIALYITIAKGFAIGHVESAWGLWLFTACVLSSFAIGLLTPRVMQGPQKT